MADLSPAAHPITPPPELVQQWLAEIWHEGTPVRVAASDLHIATQAANWGADRQKIRSGPESPLVERVADAIAAEATSAGIVNDRPARAAILQVSLWLREQDTPANNWATRLEQEATPSPRRPKPPSLAEQALALLDDASDALGAAHENTIRRALERRQELEGAND